MRTPHHPARLPSATSAARPFLRVRLSVHWHRTVLTRSLANGADPRLDDRLALLARRLRSRRVRRITARGIERVLADAEAPHVRWGSAAPFDSKAVAEARDQLRELAAALRAMESANPRGVAIAVLLLVDVQSPLYDGRVGHGLRHAAQTAIEALHDSSVAAGRSLNRADG